MMRNNNAGAGQGVSVIALGARVVGDVHTTGVVQVAGSVVGNVRAGRQVLVAKGGMVEGEIESPEAIIGGEVRGHVRAAQRVAVQASAVVYGTITTPRLGVEEGACLEVQLSIRHGGHSSNDADATELRSRRTSSTQRHLRTLRNADCVAPSR